MLSFCCGDFAGLGSNRQIEAIQTLNSKASEELVVARSELEKQTRSAASLRKELQDLHQQQWEVRENRDDPRLLLTHLLPLLDTQGPEIQV